MYGYIGLSSILSLHARSNCLRLVQTSDPFITRYQITLKPGLYCIAAFVLKQLQSIFLLINYQLLHKLGGHISAQFVCPFHLFFLKTKIHLSQKIWFMFKLKYKSHSAATPGLKYNVYTHTVNMFRTCYSRPYGNLVQILIWYCARQEGSWQYEKRCYKFLLQSTKPQVILTVCVIYVNQQAHGETTLDKFKFVANKLLY